MEEETHNICNNKNIIAENNYSDKNIIAEYYNINIILANTIQLVESMYKIGGSFNAIKCYYNLLRCLREKFSTRIYRNKNIDSLVNHLDLINNCTKQLHEYIEGNYFPSKLRKAMLKAMSEILSQFIQDDIPIEQSNKIEMSIKKPENVKIYITENNMYVKHVDENIAEYIEEIENTKTTISTVTKTSKILKHILLDTIATNKTSLKN